jgi:RNA polymerase sigma-70 factor (ECF subfamily)
VAAGERDALSELYDATSHLVYGLAFRILGEKTAAEDAVIEVYTHAWRMAPSYQAERGTASAWLLNLTRSRAIDALRARKRNKASEPLEAASDVQSDEPGPEELNVAEERRRFVVRALEDLVHDQREAIELAYFGGLSHSEIAARLQQPLGTVKTRIRLGMMKLRETLSVLEPTPMTMNQERTA